MFGYALRLDVDNIKTVVMDHDKNELSRDFILRLDASSYFDVVQHLRDSPTVTKYIDNGWAAMAVIIPPGFSEAIIADRTISLQILLDGSDQCRDD